MRKHLNRKLSDKQIKKIRKLYNKGEGESVLLLAKEFKVNRQTIYYWINSDYRKNRIALCAKNNSDYYVKNRDKRRSYSRFWYQWRGQKLYSQRRRIKKIKEFFGIVNKLSS